MVFHKVGHVARVTSTYAVEYEDPIVLKAGDAISIGRRDTQWTDFTWCTGPDGRSGWVAEAVFERHGQDGVVTRDYSAVELQVDEDEMVTIEEEYGGWSWCTNRLGESGWVPNSNLSP
jgi:hypothetical protein